MKSLAGPADHVVGNPSVPRRRARRSPAAIRLGLTRLGLSGGLLAGCIVGLVVALIAGTSPAGANPGATPAAAASSPAEDPIQQPELGPAPVFTLVPPNPALGTLGTHPATAAQEDASGVKVAMIEFNWSQEEPQEGVFSTAYESSMRSRLASLEAAGMRVTLALGLHYTPSWVSTLPGARFVDEHGNTSTQVDMVFNDQIRALAAAYVQRIATVFPLGQFWAVRITSGSNSEVLYPSGGSYWAFDASAQNGPNLPATMARNPFPGWKPGQAGLTAAQQETWADWYLGGLDDVIQWQMGLVAGLGFAGFYQVLTPGLGILPRGFQSALNNNLPDGLIGVGAVWDRVYAGLVDKTNVVAYVSSLADNSGANAGCQPIDATVALDSPLTAGWSAAEWISRIADANGLLKGGENPGYNASPTFQSNYRDPSSAGMEAVAMAQAQSCGFQVVYWAHDDQLWDGTLTLASLVSRAHAPASPPAAANS
jgi:hypothetical protein